MSYVRDAWYVTSWADSLSDKLEAITVLGEPIVMWRAGRRLVAFEDRCVHRLAPLSLGRCEGSSLRCMYHGFLYDAEGAVQEIPGQAGIPQGARVRIYPIVERHRWIWVWMGDAERADESLIPPAVDLDDPAWLLGYGSLDYDAEARLINDNLLDLSHLSITHEASLAVGPHYAEKPSKVTPLPRGVRFERWDTIAGEPSVEVWSATDYYIPGIGLSWAASFPTGTAATCNHGRPDLSLAVGELNYSGQAVTPMGDRSARYFFSWGTHSRCGDESKRDSMMASVNVAFLEDKAMIEGQQRIIDLTANPTVIPTVHDRGVIIYNRMIERLIRRHDEEAASVSA